MVSQRAMRPHQQVISDRVIDKIKRFSERQRLRTEGRQGNRRDQQHGRDDGERAWQHHMNSFSFLMPEYRGVT